jgi:ribonuclease Z
VLRHPVVALLTSLACVSFTYAISFAQQTPPKPNSAFYAVLLGTGFPRPDASRAGPSTAIVVGDKVFIVDAGRGITMRLAGSGLALNSVAAVFLTHLHSDHIDGLPDLFHSTWEFGRSTPLQLYGPDGTDNIVKGIMQFYAPDIHIRRDLTEKLPPGGAQISLHVVKEGVAYEDATVRVTAFLVDHYPVEPAFGYRFDSGGHSIVISGDTHPNPNLVKFATGADILIHEAYLPEVTPPGDTASDAAPWFIRYHSSAAEAGQDAARAGVKILVLTHLIPHGRADADSAFRSEAAKNFHGTIIVGQDLMRIDPSGAGTNLPK